METGIVFTQSEDFNRFINDNGIEEVRIVYQPHVLTNRKTYKLYSETPGEHASIDPANQNAVIYSIVNTKQLEDENGLVYEIDPETGEYDLTKPIMVDTDIDNDDYTLTTFTFSALKEHEVNIYWRDTGTNRPNDIQIQLRQNDEDYTLETFEGISENPQITTPTSNDTLYTYIVPEYDAAGQAYTYTSEISGTYSNYRYENGEESDSYLFYSQRTFECTLEWHSGHINYTPSQEEAAQYIINNFDFVDKGENKIISLTPEMITYDAETATIIISNLDEIANDGTAKVYHLNIKNPKIDAVGDEIGADDQWTIAAENPGVNSAVTDKVYQNAVISNILTGQCDFSANIEWKDADNTQNRLENHSPTGTLVLWRYADNNDPDKQDRVAQVSTHPIYTEDGYVSSVTIDDLEKYDSDGFPYKYYVKETLNYNSAVPNGNMDYDILYHNGDNLYAEDNGTITNHLSKETIFTIDAKWIAAARQGGTASVTYELQKKN